MLLLLYLLLLLLAGTRNSEDVVNVDGEHVAVIIVTTILENTSIFIRINEQILRTHVIHFVKLELERVLP